MTRYVQLSHALARQIGAGELGVGAELPSIRDLARREDTTISTVGRAYRHLGEAGGHRDRGPPPGPRRRPRRRRGGVAACGRRAARRRGRRRRTRATTPAAGRARRSAPAPPPPARACTGAAPPGRDGRSHRTRRPADGTAHLPQRWFSPISRVTTAGHRHDSLAFGAVMAGIRIRRRGPGRPRSRPGRVLGDKAFSSRAIRSHLRRRRIAATIPEPADQPGAKIDWPAASQS